MTLDRKDRKVISDHRVLKVGLKDHKEIRVLQDHKDRKEIQAPWDHKGQ